MRFFLFLCCLWWATTATAQTTVTYIGNEGFLIRGNGEKVLVDALYREGVRGYAVHPPGRRDSLERALPPYDHVNLVAASHYHADHFDAAAVLRHLQNSPSTHFLSTNQSLSRLQALSSFAEVAHRTHGVFPAEGTSVVDTLGGIAVEVFQLHHGVGRPIENLGIAFKVGGLRFLHIGDTQAEIHDYERAGLSTERFDVVFLPYWHLLTPGYGDAFRRTVRTQHVIAMHIPPPNDAAGFFASPQARADTIAQLRAALSGLIVFEAPLASRSFD